jgi:uncharacterized membrane protein
MPQTSIRKYVTCLLLAIGAFFLSRFAGLENTFSYVLAWDTFGLAYIVSSLFIFSRLDHHDIRKLCAKEDVSSWVLFGLVVTACLTGLLIVLSLLRETGEWAIPPFWSSLACITAIVVSWAMVHTSFTFRYAHLFYGDENKHFSQHAHGLIFPEELHPDYFDFAYFSFVIGMTFQVSDVVITAKGVRRLVLIHSLIAFIFNTVIIALTISQLVNFNAR